MTRLFRHAPAPLWTYKALLLAAAAIWGLGTVVIKATVDTFPPAWLVGVRFTAAGIIPPVFIQVPWVMPVGFYAFFATGGNIGAALVSLLCLAVAVVIWAPFVILANRMQNKEMQ